MNKETKPEKYSATFKEKINIQSILKISRYL